MENFKEMIDCLRNVSANDVTSAFYNFFKWDTDPMIPFPPVIEPDLPGSFLTKHPRDIKNPHGLSLPWMTGINYDEGAMKTAGTIKFPENFLFIYNNVNYLKFKLFSTMKSSSRH